MPTGRSRLPPRAEDAPLSSLPRVRVLSEPVGFYFVPCRCGDCQAVAAWFEAISRRLRLLFFNNTHDHPPCLQDVEDRGNAPREARTTSPGKGKPARIARGLALNPYDRA